MSGAGSTDKDLEMIEIQGRYNTAKVYTDNIEEAAYKQVLNLMNQKFAEVVKVIKPIYNFKASE